LLKAAFLAHLHVICDKRMICFRAY